MTADCLTKLRKARPGIAVATCVNPGEVPHNGLSSRPGPRRWCRGRTEALSNRCVRGAGRQAKNYVDIFTSASSIGHRTRNPGQDRKWICHRVSDSPRGARCNRSLSVAHLSSDTELKSHDRCRVCSSQWCTPVRKFGPPMTGSSQCQEPRWLGL